MDDAIVKPMTVEAFDALPFSLGMVQARHAFMRTREPAPHLMAILRRTFAPPDPAAYGDVPPQGTER